MLGILLFQFYLNECSGFILPYLKTFHNTCLWLMYVSRARDLQNQSEVHHLCLQWRWHRQLSDKHFPFHCYSEAASLCWRIFSLHRLPSAMILTIDLAVMLLALARHEDHVSSHVFVQQALSTFQWLMHHHTKPFRKKKTWFFFPH